jgi:hypothetical protein
MVMVKRFLLGTAACAAVLVIAAPGVALASSSSAAAACGDGGYVNFVRDNGSPFKDIGACVSYSARGGTLMPVSLTASFVPDPTRQLGDVTFEDVTVTGTGLLAGSTVTASYVPTGSTERTAPQPTAGNSTVAADGSFFASSETGCPLDSSFEFYATTAYGLPITASGC